MLHMLVLWTPGASSDRGPKDHIHIRILHSGSKAQEKGDSRCHGFVGSLCVCGIPGPPTYMAVSNDSGDPNMDPK